jgi:hypothetical protein
MASPVIMADSGLSDLYPFVMDIHFSVFICLRPYIIKTTNATMLDDQIISSVVAKPEDIHLVILAEKMTPPPVFLFFINQKVIGGVGLFGGPPMRV